jgi:hypothetical protein
MLVKREFPSFLCLWKSVDNSRTFFAWANDIMRFEDESFRVVVLASMNMMSNAVNAWWSIIFYGATYAPYFTVWISLSSI